MLTSLKFCYILGLRRGEIACLTWDDVDFAHNTITIDKACDYSQNKPQIKSTKNGKARVIPILDIIRPILNSRFKESHSKYVFHKADNTILTESAIRRMLDIFKREVGFEFSLHQLRHTYCTMLYYSGVSSKKAQQLMRSFFFRRYPKDLYAPRRRAREKRRRNFKQFYK